jgi:hypothetical protein
MAEERAGERAGSREERRLEQLAAQDVQGFSENR